MVFDKLFKKKKNQITNKELDEKIDELNKKVKEFKEISKKDLIKGLEKGEEVEKLLKEIKKLDITDKKTLRNIKNVERALSQYLTIVRLLRGKVKKNESKTN